MLYFTPEMILGVNAIVEKKGRILLIRREDLGIWALPGGLIEPGETLEQATIRETEEETGVKVQIQKLTGIYLRTIPFFENTLLAYRCRYQSSIPTFSKETRNLGWFSLDEIKRIAPSFVGQIVSYALSSNKNIKIGKLNSYEPWLIYRFLSHRLRKKFRQLLRNQ